MASILEEVQDRFLDSVSKKALDPEACTKDVITIKSLESTKEERMAAEERIWTEIQRTGELLVHGDIGIVEGIEGAKRIRDQCGTSRERLDYVKVAITGILHIQMNATIQNIQQKLLVANSTHDILSLANLRTACQGNLDFISNVENDIKVREIVTVTVSFTVTVNFHCFIFICKPLGGCLEIYVIILVALAGNET